MTREDLKKAFSIELELTAIEAKLDIWKKANSYDDFDRLTKVMEPGINTKDVDLHLRDIPFEKLKTLFIEHYEVEKEKVDESLKKYLSK